MNVTSLRVAEIGLYCLWKHFSIRYLETLPLFFTFRIRVTVEHALLSSASRGCRGFAVISIRTETMGYEPWLLMEAVAPTHYHSAWQAERKQIRIERKRSRAHLCVLMLALVLKSISRIIRVSLHLPETSLEMKSCLQSWMMLLGFNGHLWPHWTLPITYGASVSGAQGRKELSASSESFLLVTVRSPWTHSFQMNSKIPGRGNARHKTKSFKK